MTDPIEAHVDRVVIESGKDITITLVCSRRFRDECMDIAGRDGVLLVGWKLLKEDEIDGQ